MWRWTELRRWVALGFFVGAALTLAVDPGPGDEASGLSRISAGDSPIELLDPTILLDSRGTALAYRTRHRRRPRQTISLIELDRRRRSRGPAIPIAVADEPLSAPALASDGRRYLILWSQGGALWGATMRAGERPEAPRRLHPRARSVCGAVAIRGGWAVAWDAGDTVFVGRLDRRGRVLELDDTHHTVETTGCAVARTGEAVFVAWSYENHIAYETGATLAAYGLDGERRFVRGLAEKRSPVFGPVALAAAGSEVTAVVFDESAPARVFRSDESGAVRSLEPVPVRGEVVGGALAFFGPSSKGGYLAVATDDGRLWRNHLDEHGQGGAPTPIGRDLAPGSAISMDRWSGSVALTWSDGETIWIWRVRERIR